MAIAADDGRDEAGQRLRLLQLNVFLRPAPLGLLRSEHKERRRAALAARLGDLDVVCLQECFAAPASRRRRLVRDARAAGLAAAAWSPRGPWFARGQRGCLPRLKLVDPGLVILSRWPLVATESRQFSHGCAVDAVVAKGMLYARADLGRSDGRQLHIFTAHTQASYEFTPDAASRAARAAQLDELVAFMQQVLAAHPGHWPVVLLGDFNVDSMQATGEYEELVRRVQAVHPLGGGMMDAMRLAGEKGAVATTVEYEWETRTGLSRRSALFQRDAAAAAAAAAAVTADGKRGSTFWQAQCLDYVFVGPGLQVASAAVDPLPAPAGSPFVQVSDHHGLRVELTLAP